MKEERFRNKVIWFTFVYSILVIWVHSYNSELYLGQTAHAAVIWRLEHVLGDVIGQIAVPGFFMLSGYLFFRNFAWNKLQYKWNSRIKSVLVPFIVWNTLYYLGYVLASHLPVLTDVVNKGVIALTLPAAVDAIINYTYNYVFWYLYQLILLIILAPIIYLLLYNFHIACVYLAAILIAIYLELSLPLLNLDALLYYSAAAFFAVHWKTVSEGSWNKKRAICGLCMLIASILIWILGSQCRIRGAVVLTLVLFRLLTSISLWVFVNEKLLPAAPAFMNHNFFLYAVHFAIVRFINKSGAMIFGGVPYLPLFIYLFMPVVVVASAYYSGALLRRFAPVFWKLLSGGR